jgi:hypothetical protein
MAELGVDAEKEGVETSDEKILAAPKIAGSKNRDMAKLKNVGFIFVLLM